MAAVRPVRTRGWRVAALVSLAALLAACQGETVSRNDPNRGNRPISQAVLEELNVKGMTRTSPVLMRIFKEEAELEVWKRDATGRYALFKTYPICNYSGDLGPKVREGDRQSPEGFYQINMGLMNPRSSYYLAFNMGFPNQFDRSYGRTGSHLMVHGDCSSRGCYAMTDEAIAEVYALAREALQGGQDSFQVQAYPFRMTPRNIARHRNNPNMVFWRNLKEGYDHFEVTRQEPQVDVCERRYVFNAVSPQSVLAQGGGSETREMIAANDPWAGTRGAGSSRANVTTSAAPRTPVPTSLNQPVTTMAPVTREAPARTLRTRFTAVGDDTSAPRPNFQAASACPAYVVPAPIRQAVAAKNARDMAQVAALSREIAAAPPRSGIDGGTHRTFAARFAHRQIRVGSSEQTFSLASQQSEPVTLVSARSPAAPAAASAPVLAAASSTPVAAPVAAATPSSVPALEASVANAITAPVPVPSPLRTTVASRSSGPVQAQTLSAFAPEPAQPPAEQGNWLSRTMGSIGIGQQAPVPGEAPQVANQGGARN
jgi:murein L,D-transpeptidase YafK